MAVAGPWVDTPRASGPISGQTASQPPRSDQPAENGTTARAVGLFHHRVIDGDILGFRPGLRCQPQETQIGLCLRHRCQHLRRMGLESLQNSLYGKQEKPRIPEIATLRQHRLRGDQIRLFHKTFERGDTLDGLACQLQIAIARLGPVWGDAKGDQQA